MYDITIPVFGYQSNAILVKLSEDVSFNDIVNDIKEAKNQILDGLEGEEYNASLLMSYVQTTYGAEVYNVEYNRDPSAKRNRYSVTVKIGKDLDIPDTLYLFATTNFGVDELLVLKLSVFNDPDSVTLTRDHGEYTGILEDPVSFTMDNYFITI